MHAPRNSEFPSNRRDLRPLPADADSAPVPGSRAPLLDALNAALLLTLALAAPAASAVDWSAVEARDVELLYPGQASWEWTLTEKDHSGAPKFRAGKNCRECHDGEQKDMGQRIATGEKLEPAPIEGKPGGVKAKVRFAHDAERLYAQIVFTPGPASGTKQDADESAHVTVMIDDGTVKEFTRAGCWAACHDDAIGMASAPAGVSLTKYLGASRAKLSRQGGGENYKPDADLGALAGQGAFLEFWQAELEPGQDARAASGWILDKRHAHEPPISTATATFANGAWTVELSRPLAGGEKRKALQPGKTYSVGFAIHDDYAEHRYHYVSLEHTLSLDAGTADFVAKGL
jgi:cytochrome c-type protein NapC